MPNTIRGAWRACAILALALAIRALRSIFIAPRAGRTAALGALLACALAPQAAQAQVGPPLDISTTTTSSPVQGGVISVQLTTSTLGGPVFGQVTLSFTLPSGYLFQGVPGWSCSTGPNVSCTAFAPSQTSQFFLGIPTFASTGPVSIPFTLSATGFSTGTSTLDLTIVNPAPTLSAQFFTPTIAYDQGLGLISVATLTNPTGNPTSWTMSGTSSGIFGSSLSFPGGGTMSIDATGTVQFRPPSSARGTYTFYVRASNAQGTSATVPINVKVGDPTLALTPSTLADGIAGSSYSATASASGGKSPYSYALAGCAGASCSSFSAGTTAGLSINAATGAITGTPTAGSYVLQVTATDSSTNPSGASSPFSQSFTRSFTASTPVPAFGLSMTHTGNAVRGQNIVYTITPTVTGADTSGPITVGMSFVSGLNFRGMTGAGWDCTRGNVCTTTIPIPAGSSGPPISLTVLYDGDAPNSLYNAQAYIHGGGTTGTVFASDPTTVVSPAPTVETSLGQNSILRGGSTPLTVTLVHTGYMLLSNVGSTLTLPTGVTRAGTPATFNNCGGTLVADADKLVLTGASLSPTSNCSFGYSITSATSGSFGIVADAPTATEIAPGVASNTATLTVLAPTAPTAAVSDVNPGTIRPGEISAISVRLTNTNASTGLSGVGLTVNLPSGLVLAAAPLASQCSGTVAGTTGGGTVTLSGGQIGAGTSSTCAIGFAVKATTAGTYPIPAGIPTSTESGDGVAGTAGSLTVNPPAAFSLALSHTGTPTQGQTFALRPAVTNTGGSATMGAIRLTGALPTGLSFVSASGGGWNCAGSGGTIVDCSLAGALAAGGTDTSLEVTVAVASGAGVSQPVTISVSGGGAANPATASDNVTVTQVPAALLNGTGTGQSARINTAFAAPLVVTVADGAQTPVAGVSVTFTAPSSGASGTFANGRSTETVVTNGSGVAASSAFTANGTPGTYQVALAAGALNGNFQLTNTPPALAATPAVSSVSATLGAPAPFTPVKGTGGFGTLHYAISPSLPAGLSFDAGSGAISGSPTAALGATTFTVTVTDDTPGTPQTASATFQLAVAKGTPTIVFAALGDLNISATAPALSATSPSPSPIVFSSTTTGVCTVSGTAVTLVATGTCTIAADQAGDANWNSAAQATRSFQVTPDPVGMTTGPVSGAAVGASFSQSNTATGGITPYSYNLATGALPRGTSLDDRTGLVSGTPNTAGPFTYSIRVNDNNGNGVGVPGTVVSGVIAPGTQTITFVSVAPGGATVGGSYKAVANAVSRLPVAFTIDAGSSGVCTISSGIAHFTGAGTCTINADQAGDANWTPAARVQQSFTIGKLATTTAVTSPGAIVAGANVSYTAVVGGGSPTGTVTFLDGADQIAGCVDVTLSGGAAICVQNAPAAGLHGITAVYSGDASYLGSTSSALNQRVNPALTTTQAVASITGTRGTALAGVTPVTASGGVGNYTYSLGGAVPAWANFDFATGELSGTPTAGLAPTVLTVTVTDQTPGTPQRSSQTFTLAIAGSPSSVTISPTTAIVAGADATYNAIVTGASPTGTLTFRDGGADIAGCVNLALAGGSASCVQARPAAGTHSITAIYSGDTNNLGDASAPLIQTVHAALTTSVNIAAVSANVGAELASIAPVTASGGVGTISYALGGPAPAWLGFDSATGKLSGKPIAALATVTLTVTATDQTPGAAQVSTGSFTLTVGQGAQTIAFTSTAPSAARVGGVAYTPQARATSNLPVAFTIDASSSGVCTVSGGTVRFTGAGTCRIDADQAGDANYSAAAQQQQSITVSAAIAAPTAGTPADGAVLGGNTPTITGGAETGATVTVVIDGVPVGTATAATGGAWSFTTAALAEGEHTVRSFATDAAGNVSPDSPTTRFTIDTTAPSAPASIAPANGATINSPTPTISGTAEANATITIMIDGQAVGTATANAGGAWSFTAGTLAEGVHTLRAIATDVAGNVSSSSGTTTFTVDAIAPAAPMVVAPADGSTMADNTPAISGTAEANATVAVSIDGAVAGTTSANAGGAWSFTAATLADGGHSAVATATDAAGNVSGNSNARSFTIDTRAPAAPVIASPRDGSSTDLTQPVIGGTAEADATVTVVLDGATAGTVKASAGGSWSFTPGIPLAPGAHDVRATAADSVGNVSPFSATISFTVMPAPVAADRSGIAVAYATPTPIDLGASITGVHTSIAIAAAPAHGTTSIAGDVVTYTPAAGYYGADSFTYTATGPGGTSPAATVSLTVATPPAPVAADKGGVTVSYQSTGTAIDLSGSVTGVHGSIAIGTSPTHGTVSVAGDVITYTPAAGYYGADSFTYAATGPGGTSAPATVSLTVGTPPAPVVVDKSGVAIGYNSTGTAIDLAASVKGVHASIAVGTAPAHGAVAIAGDVATYTPATGYYGADSFTYTATGPGGTSAAATVSLTVGTPPAPAAADKPGVAVVYASTGTAIDLSTSITGVHTGIAIGTAPAHGTTTIAGDVVTYVPAPAYYGADSFTYTATGPGGTSAAAKVTIEVGLPPAPVAADKSGVAVAYGAATPVDLSGSITGVHNGIAIGTAPAHGTAATAGDVVTYTPAPGYAGADSLTYTAMGPGGTSTAATVSLTVGSPSIAITTESLADGRKGDAYSVTLAASGGTAPYSYRVGQGTLPAGLMLSEKGVLEGVPTEFGSYAVTISATDSSTGAGPFTANRPYTLVIAPPPPPAATDAPAATVASSTVTNNQSTDIDLSAQVTGEYDEIRIETQPEHGTVTLRREGGQGAQSVSAHGTSRSGGRYIATYTPAVGYHGTDDFTFVAVGAGGTSRPASVTITVTGLKPVAPALTATTIAGIPVTVDLTSTAREAPFTGATIVSVTPADKATARLIEGGTAAARTYKLEVQTDGHFGGSAVVTYTLTNAFGTSDPATVTLNVTARPDPSADPTVRGLVTAQAEATRRFGQVQIGNFQRRNEQLHNGGNASRGQELGMSLTGGDRMVRQRPGMAIEIPEAMAVKMEHAVENWGAERAAGAAMIASTEPMGGIATPASMIGRRASTGVAPSNAMPGGGREAAGGGDGERQIGSGAIWSGGAIEIGVRDETTGRRKLSLTSSGLSAGMDVKLADGLILGAGGGYGGERTEIGDDDGRMDAKNWVGVAYGSYRPAKDAFIDVIAGMGGLDFKTRRIAANNMVATGQRDGTLRFGSISAGYDGNGELWRISAYGRVDYVGATLGRYSESGAGLFDLRFDRRELSSLSSVLGARISAGVPTSFGLLSPRGRFEWRHEFQDSGAQLLDFADLIGSTYRIDGDGWLRDEFSFEVGFGLDLETGWKLGLDFGGRKGQGSQSGTLKATVSKQF